MLQQKTMGAVLGAGLGETGVLATSHPRGCHCNRKDNLLQERVT